MMGLKIRGINTQPYISGQTKEFLKYEKDIMSGKEPCPFKVEFRDKDGNIITTNPIPLTTEGRPRINLFG